MLIDSQRLGFYYDMERDIALMESSILSGLEPAHSKLYKKRLTGIFMQMNKIKSDSILKRHMISDAECYSIYSECLRCFGCVCKDIAHTENLDSDTYMMLHYLCKRNKTKKENINNDFKRTHE